MHLDCLEFMKRPNVNEIVSEHSTTSTELLRQAQSSNQEAWRQLVVLYGRRVYRWCRHTGLQPTDANNVSQETLLAVSRKLKDFRRDHPGGTFRGWLRRITENKIRDHFRRHGRCEDAATGGTDALQRMKNVTGDHENDGPSWDTTSASAPRTTEQQKLLQYIELARQEISERDWKFFWRVAVDGQSAADVGREFGVTANTVRLVKMRVLRRLRQGKSSL